ncbi:MAG: hypothetical protein IKD42_04235, partial [Kiritimatiellae bacterium]|nr:hypothetical protein [Kiritimatiellia bacterium]
FGNDDLGLKAAFRRLPQKTLGSDGAAVFSAPLRPSDGRPKAAVKATVQGVVFEDGGRPAAGRASAVCHVYPFYIGAVLPGWVEKPEDGVLEIPVACVMPDGSRAPGGKKLSAKVESVESIFAYKSGDGGWGSWTCERVRAPVTDGMELETLPDASSVLRLDLKSCGDYVLTVSDPESGASFSRAFFLGDGAEETSAPLGNPAEVVLVPDKAFYRPGETPRILVRSPFAGTALVSVVRDRIVSVKSIELGTATGEIVLDPVDAALAPSVDVAVAVVKPVAENNDERMAVRAHGAATLSIRPAESELSVTLAPKVEFVPGGAVVTVAVDSSSVSGGGKRATITVVDEGINLLSGGNEPDPSGFFARPRSSEHPLYDMYGRILPVDDDVLRASGMKTGGGFGASLFARVSPVPTRRFKPLSLWKKNVSLENGKAEVKIRIPEFSGEVRVTALVYSASATGAASVLCKVSPRLVAEPDAPRFVAPGDEFEAVLPLRNTSDRPGRVKWSVSASGEAAIEGVHDGEVVMTPGESVLAFVRARALGPGQAEFGFSAEGLGERHEHRISLPVRPAVPWRETVKVLRLEPGEKAVVSAEGGFARHSLALSPSRLGEFSAALGWLADYPHGCLEQTVSRIFPLVAAGGALNAAASGSSSLGPAFIAAGIGRVESMIREHDFSMWPDCDYAPWDREVSLYAAHFLVEAEKSGRCVSPHARKSVLEFLGRWASSTNAAEAAYACHTLALAGVPDKDRMFSLYDNRADLGLLSRSRLARAFSAVRDRKRAEALLSGVFDPQSVEEAAFAMLALLETNPSDGRVEKLKAYLESRRDRAKFSWGTTHANAHALIALGEYFRHNPVKEGLASVSAVSSSGAEMNLACGASAVLEGKTLSLVNTSDATAFLTVRTFDLPAETSGGKIPEGLSVSCRFFDSEGREADLGSLACGELLVADIAVTSAVKRVLSDLVVENLFAGAFEPVLDSGCLAAKGKEPWVMRSDARDDRMLVFSKKFTMEAGSEVHFRYPVRVVSAGRFVLPGPALEGMYDSSLDCRRACSSIVVRR